jgi:hypothetical protein
MELKWPVDKCESCEFDLTKKEPQAMEKGVNQQGKPIWTDFCPRCGRGYPVGDRTLPKLVSAEEQPILKLPVKEVEEAEEPETLETESTGESQAVDRSKMVAEKAPEPVVEETPPTPDQPAQDVILTCDVCGKVCKSASGLYSHKLYTHKEEAGALAR